MTRLERQFEQFIVVHPEAYDEFKRQAEELYERGWGHYSARTIVAVMRFHSDVDSRDVDHYRINDHHSPYLARKLAREDARFTDFFEMREVEGDEEEAA